MGKKRILVTDDEPSILHLLHNMLHKDYTVFQASNGTEAITIAHKEKPDIILMDIMMPGMDGYTACHAIKSDPATSEIPVVMLTGLGQELNKRLADQIGADGYITKPFTSQELFSTICLFENIRDASPDHYQS
jgi:CheY-like chemotaxis protein